MIYTAYNAVAPTTSAFVPVTTGTAPKTMLQIATPASQGIRLRAWGICFDGFTAAAPVVCTLFDGSGGASVLTAHVAAGIHQYDAEALAGGGTSIVTLGAAATGYAGAGAPTEGTVASTRVADRQLVPPSSGYSYEWALGKEFQVAASRFLRIRVDAVAAVGCMCWIRWEE